MKLLLAVLMLLAGALPAAAQWLDRPWPGIPRTADGTPNLTAPAPRGPDGRPDLTGVWTGPAPVARPDPAALQPWVTDLARRRQQEYYKQRPYFRCLPSGPETERSGGWKRFLQTPTAVAILNDDLTYRVNPPGRPRAGSRPLVELDGLLGGALGRRHAGRRQRRVQRQDVGESLRGLAYRGAAGHGALPASRLRPPAGGGDLHRSRRVRGAVGLYGEHGAGGRYGHARGGLRTEQRRTGRAGSRTPPIGR